MGIWEKVKLDFKLLVTPNSFQIEELKQILTKIDEISNQKAKATNKTDNSKESELNETISNLNSEITNLKKENQTLQADLNAERTKIKKESEPKTIIKETEKIVEVEKIVKVPEIKTVEKIIEKIVVKEDDFFKQHKELYKKINPKKTLEEFIFKTSQFDELTSFYDKLKDKALDKKEISETDKEYYKLCLESCNKAGSDLKFTKTETNQNYDYEKQFRVNDRGDVVKKVYCQGIIDSGNNLKKKSIVECN